MLLKFSYKVIIINKRYFSPKWYFQAHVDIWAFKAAPYDSILQLYTSWSRKMCLAPSNQSVRLFKFQMYLTVTNTMDFESEEYEINYY